MNNILKQIITNNGIEFFGTCLFSDVKENLIKCRNLSKIPQNAKTVICMLFPYKVSVNDKNISRYAIVKDYHVIVNGILNKISKQLKEYYNDYSFEYFCDNSPINERKAAQLCNLGVLGDNGLIINQKYGSWVFIGEIVTDLEIPIKKEFIKKECLHCGACKRFCASGILNKSSFKKEDCLSFITQKKSKLSLKEKELIFNAKTAWGCDVCQECCPLNKNTPDTPLEQFKFDVVSVITEKNYNNLLNRAYGFRPLYVIQRNIRILNSKCGYNNL